jgi:hypothetical protein
MYALWPTYIWAVHYQAVGIFVLHTSLFLLLVHMAMIYSQHVFATMNYAKLRKLSFKANISAARAYRQTNDSLWFSPPLI